MNFGFVIDNRNCIGCHACTVACKSEHDVPIGVNRTWVKYVEKGQFPDTRRVFSVMRCNHCENAPCVEICPTQALYTRPDGIVDFNNDRCIGCKSCTQACPYDAIYIDPENHTAAKCNYCTQKVDNGLQPACVTVCPTEAIISGDLDDPGSKIANLVARQQVTARKPEKGTRPKLFYIEGDDVSLKPLETEHSGQSLWGSQESGVGHHSGKEHKHSVHFGASDNGSNVNTEKSLSFDRGLSGGSRPSRRVYDAPSKGILWGWEVAGYILTKALAAGILGLPLLLNQLGLVSLSSEMLWVTSLVSLIFLRGHRSVADQGFGPALTLPLCSFTSSLEIMAGPWRLHDYGLRRTGDLDGSRTFFRICGNGRLVRLAGPGAFYPACDLHSILFAQAKGRDFWQSPLLILHMLLHAVVGGCAALLLAGFLWEPIAPMIPYLQNILIGGLVVQVFSLGAELIIPHPTEDSHRTVKIITRGFFKSQFWFGVILVGSLLPFLMLLWSTTPLMLALAGILVLIGIWYSVRIWVVAPQMIPLS